MLSIFGVSIVLYFIKILSGSHNNHLVQYKVNILFSLLFFFPLSFLIFPLLLLVHQHFFSLAIMDNNYKSKTLIPRGGGGGGSQST